MICAMDVLAAQLHSIVIAASSRYICLRNIAYTYHTCTDICQLRYTIKAFSSIWSTDIIQVAWLYVGLPTGVSYTIPPYEC